MGTSWYGGGGYQLVRGGGVPVDSRERDQHRDQVARSHAGTEVQYLRYDVVHKEC